MRKVAFYTLGCKLNFSETSTIARQFEERGYERVEFSESADIFVINTCSVTENADKKCKQVVKQAKKTSPNSYVIIIGCYAQLKPQEIATIKGVDAVLGAAEKFRLFEVLNDFEQKDTVQLCASEISQATDFNTAYSYGDRTRTFLKVQDGCDYNCAFCTIPLARGNSRSDTVENILKAAKEIAATNVKEIVLTGVNTGDYGLINNERVHTFFELVQELDKIEGIERFRISSIEPNLLSDEIIEFVAKSKKFVPHFHIPLQSGSDEILRFMRRRYKTSLYNERIEKIKKLMPNACIGVDVIVGFPGESNEHFMETYNFLHSLDISYLHVFTYSERQNTKAAEMGNPVPKSVRAERSKMLHSLSDKKRNFFYESQLGKTKTVLWENEVKENKIFGFTENYIRVNQPYNVSLPNTLQEVELKDFDLSTSNITVNAIPVSELV
ncbi:MiaB-like tRNA modifying enzyme [Bernardetia litoralis DSM 6794]|uniref:Threonylcarbamoyladenosine tRNA methylthiotransferase MtaB n=1 Tax=Bernardetia litoralis (strain ATCC 23117 / DSM 6794 / NBRC 15988 / NCIMB 1366 / Fx l1 / Sio-4) TaxID=880071 RepID=I4AHR9_BERLS|nr:tRNA (N(6)-L-threonylcarbamoyladenosine(37)-C(2))-methylthiotransferase MtaB [Bernardetia litoralis]AFM03504.1 MiaB-like tRNA modifying enzyme [Bernardetia litoralis DSM 6794]